MIGADGDLGAALLEAARLRHTAIHPKAELIDRLLVEHARALGLALHAWTVNDADEVARLARLGVDGVITDVPDLALAAL